MLILRGINFGSVHGASGVTGFFGGDEYPHHGLYRKLFKDKFNFGGMTEVAKTSTAYPHKGNTRLASDGYSIKRMFPRSVYFLLALFNIMLNAIGLSGPGLEFLLKQNKWQSKIWPFFLSFMLVKGTKEERLAEARYIVSLLKKYMHGIVYGIQLNFSCPNTKHGQEELIDEVHEVLAIFAELNVPLVPKFNILLSPEKVAAIMKDENCDAVCMGNTLPYSALKGRIPAWAYHVIRATSWLKKFGGGGLSGKYLFPLLCDWLVEARQVGMPKPIIACGGISRRRDIYQLWERFPFVQAISIGTIAITRPWRVSKLIDYANRRFEKPRPARHSVPRATYLQQ